MTFAEYEAATLGMRARCYLVGTQHEALKTAVLGLCSEAGEIASAIKKAEERCEPLDIANLMEEVGDVQWYLPLIAWLLGTDLDTVAHANLAKLAARHGRGGLATPVVPAFGDV